MSIRAILVVSFITLGSAFGATLTIAQPATVLASCPHGYYENSDGQCIPDERAPTTSGPPPGATAVCRDGTYSFSTHHSGTCSGHGGVDHWL